jgi:hypothetical protein
MMKYPSAPEQIPIFGIKAKPLTPVAQQIAELVSFRIQTNHRLGLQ